MPPPRPAASALIDLSHRPLLLACGDQSGDEALTRIAENGFEQVYVGRDSLGFRIGATDVTAAQLGEASADAERKGLGLHATLIGGSLGDDDGGVADYHRILTHCEALGMRWVLDFGPPTPEDHKGYISLMKAVAPRAAELGLGISMKPHGTCLSNADLLQVVQEVQHPAFGIALDPGNVVYYTEGAEDPVEGLAELVPHVSVCIMKDCSLTKDGTLDEYGTSGVDVLIVPGTGVVDFRSVAAILSQGGFSGPLLLEKVPGVTLEEIDDGFTRGRAFCRAVWGGGADAAAAVQPKL